MNDHDHFGDKADPVAALRSALERSEHRFRVVVDGAPDGVLIVRRDEVRYSNQVAAQMLGFESTQSAIGQSLSARLHPDDRSVALARMRTMAETGERHRSPIEYRSIATQRAGRRFEVMSIPIEYEGAPSIVAFVRDTTERHENQKKLLRADRLAALGTLSAGMAHELSSPLSYMLLNIEHLIRAVPTVVPNDRAKDLMSRLEDVRQAATRLSALVSDLRVFARGSDDHTTAVNVLEVVKSAAKLLEHRIDDNIALRITTEQAPEVLGNFSQLGQVFLNLLLNAVQAIQDASRPGVVRVEVTSDEDAVCVQIIDDGPGMDPEVLDRVFDPFFTTKPIGVGTGLGLPICRGLVESLGGDLQVESAVGAGTRCIVTLPRYRLQSSVPPPTAPASAPLAHGAVPRQTVWVIDDEKRLADTVRLLLDDTYDVVVLHSAEQAEHSLATAPPPDAILCDLNMPGKGGAAFFEHLRTAYPKLARRLAFVTGGATSRQILGTLQDPIPPVLEKPFAAAALRKLVVSLLGAGALPLPTQR